MRAREVRHRIAQKDNVDVRLQHIVAEEHHPSDLADAHRRKALPAARRVRVGALERVAGVERERRLVHRHVTPRAELIEDGDVDRAEDERCPDQYHMRHKVRQHLSYL
eukprot:4715406-Pleurochrysis_carterae.AAC.3